MRSSIIASVMVLALVVCSCGIRKPVTAGLHSYETVCLSANMDGTLTLRVWASGANRDRAVTEACKKAVNEVIFTGIKAGNVGQNKYPLVDEPNARVKYEDYFNSFFRDGGPYGKYVSAVNQLRSGVDRFQGEAGPLMGITVNVDRPGLKQQLINDNIIK